MLSFLEFRQYGARERCCQGSVIVSPVMCAAYWILVWFFFCREATLRKTGAPQLFVLGALQCQQQKVVSQVGLLIIAMILDVSCDSTLY